MPDITLDAMHLRTALLQPATGGIAGLAWDLGTTTPPSKERFPSA